MPTNPDCLITFSIFIEGAATAYSGTWVSVNPANGDISLKKNLIGKQRLILKVAQRGVERQSNVFDLEVSCPPNSKTQIG